MRKNLKILNLVLSLPERDKLNTIQITAALIILFQTELRILECKLFVTLAEKNRPSHRSNLL